MSKKHTIKRITCNPKYDNDETQKTTTLNLPLESTGLTPAFVMHMINDIRTQQCLYEMWWWWEGEWNGKEERKTDIWLWVMS